MLEISKVGSAIGQGAGQVAEAGISLVKQAITWDRSGQIFGKGEAQLRGRAREMINNFVGTLLGSIFFSYALYSCVTSPGFLSHLTLGATGVSTLLKFKELVLQSLARAKEKKELEAQGIVESKATTYTLIDFMDEMTENYVTAFRDFKNLILGKGATPTAKGPQEMHIITH